MTADVAVMESGSMSSSQLSPVGRFENVLLATDGSEFSSGAEHVAIEFCVAHQSHLHVLSAIISPDEAGWLGGQADQKVEQTLDENLLRLKKAAKDAGVECTTQVRSGSDPYEVIVDLASSLTVDMIIMGRRGRRGLARLMMGDATAKVIGYAPCAVLVVPEIAHMWSSILIATDGSRYSDMAAVTAAELAKSGNTTLNVLSVRVPSHSERRQNEAQPIVDRVLGFLEDQGVQARGVVEEGAADEVIVDVAKDKNAGLIVLGNFGRTGLGRVLFGSKDERVINAVNIPVLIVRGGG